MIAVRNIIGLFLIFQAKTRGTQVRKGQHFQRKTENIEKKDMQKDFEIFHFQQEGIYDQIIVPMNSQPFGTIKN